MSITITSSPSTTLRSKARLKLDAVLTVSVGEKEYIVKIVSSYQMEFASDERGTYTGTVEETETTLFLDGFGTATAGGNEESSIVIT